MVNNNQISKEMSILHRFVSVHFRNFKAFKDYHINLRHFNILVGPNNSGKSTVLSAFRILAEAIRRARTKNPLPIQLPKDNSWGYHVSLSEIPIAAENIFFDYDDTQPASIDFKLSNGNLLRLIFPRQGICYLIPDSKKRTINNTTQFKKEFNVSIASVPILGPVEHDEPIYQQEAARHALLSHRASRNFRNIWYHYPDNYDLFRQMIQSTWPGMDIQFPEIDSSHERPILRMFCPEDRILREIFWAGFGFQVWCQMITYIVQGKNSSILIVDEPDIYLHSDLQRQLLGILKNLGPDILIATHSTEIISEAEPDDMIIINKSYKSGRRIKDPTELQQIFNVLGSNLNPVLTQLAKTKRALFVEGKDFQIYSRFARKLGKEQLAVRSDFAVISVEGFNPQKVSDFTKGVETTLGVRVLVGVVFDRDYRSDEEVKAVLQEFVTITKYAHIHSRKELENYLLVPNAIKNAILHRIAEHNKRANVAIIFSEDVNLLLDRITLGLRNRIQAQYHKIRYPLLQKNKPEMDPATINEILLSNFDLLWNDFAKRMMIVPGKDVLSYLNRYLQGNYQVTITPNNIIDGMGREDVPAEMVELISNLDEFRQVHSAELDETKQ